MRKMSKRAAAITATAAVAVGGFGAAAAFRAVRKGSSEGLSGAAEKAADTPFSVAEPERISRTGEPIR